MRIMKAAADAVFPALRSSLEEAGEPIDEHTAVSAGFYIGLATAWLLMMSIHGGAR